MVFCSFDSIYVEDLRSKIFLVLVKNSPSWAQYIMSFGVWEEYGKILLAFSSYALKYFPRIHRIRKKNGEYAENFFYLQQCLTKLKGQYFEKIEWGIINWPIRWTNYKFYFLVIFSLKSALSVKGEHAKQRKKPQLMFWNPCFTH